MTTKLEVKEHYASKSAPNDGMCSPFVEKFLENVSEDENGIYSPVNEQLFRGERDYYTLESIKHAIRAALRQYIKDLENVAEI